MTAKIFLWSLGRKSSTVREQASRHLSGFRRSAPSTLRSHRTAMSFASEGDVVIGNRHPSEYLGGKFYFANTEFLRCYWAGSFPASPSSKKRETSSGRKRSLRQMRTGRSLPFLTQLRTVCGLTDRSRATARSVSS